MQSSALVPETKQQLHQLIKQVCETQISSNERLDNQEFAGDFAVRYITDQLRRHKQIRKRAHQRKKQAKKDGETDTGDTRLEV